MVLLKRIFTTMKFLLIFISLVPNSFSSVLHKCPDFQAQKESEHSETMSSQSFEETHKSLIIPSHLMSHFEATEFRLEPSTFLPCSMNYEKITISLAAPIVTSKNSSTSEPVILNLYGDEDKLNLNQSLIYEPFPKSRNTSHQEEFMYSIDNITVISETSNEEEEGTNYRKLSREEVQFTRVGFLLHSGEYYRPTEFCVESVNEEEKRFTIKKCNIDCDDESTPCIPLCCHLHEYVDLSAPCCQCSVGPEPMFQPVIYGDINRRLSLEETMDPAKISVSSETSAASNDSSSVGGVRPHYVTFKFHKTCPNGLATQHLFFNGSGDSIFNIRIHVQNTGKVAYIGHEREWMFLDTFCVAGLVNTEESDWEGMNEMDALMGYCLNPEEATEEDYVLWPYYAYIGSYGGSSIFLFLTAATYITLWDKQNIHGWTILSFVVSEFFLFVLLSVAYALSVFTYHQNTANTFYCVGIAISSHFFFLSTFCWLTIINLDLWWTFQNLSPLSERSKGKKRFCLYMLFAWGIPATTVTIGLILQHVYKENSSGILTPDYGNRQCFLEKHAKGVYLYYIVGALLLINLFLISFTFFTIYKFKKSTRMATSSSSKSRERSFQLFLKLVVIMGLTWVLEIVVWLKVNKESNLTWYYLAIDVFNILQAVAIFFIFVCKRKIINQLEQKHPSLRVITKPLLRLMTGRSPALGSSTESKPTRSTTATSSILQGSSKRRQKPSISDHKV